MDLFIYLAKASLLLALFWVVYKLVLETETYHRWKRIYLHLGYALSLILPLLTFTKIKEITYTPSFFVPSSSEFVPTEIKPTNFELAWSFITEYALIEILYVVISMVFLIHLMMKFYKLLRFLKRSKAIKTKGIFHIETSIPEGAFSFLNYIVYDPKLYSEDELKIILAHEKAHVTHKHSLDILFAHLYKCAFWFNPFAWLYQKSLVLNLEYEADAKVVDKTTKKDYQLTLFNITQQQFKSQLQHSFHQSPIKKRIAMLNKNKQNQSFWKLFIVSPLLVMFFLFFQVETKAQVKESVTSSEAKVTKIEFTYDENTTKEDLESTAEFLKEDFNIDMTYSNLVFDSKGQLKSITLEVSTKDGFSDTAKSTDVASMPVYFFSDFSDNSKPSFGVGTKAKSEVNFNPDYKTIKDAENFIINGNKISKEELLEKYIPVENYNYDKISKTLNIKTRSEFSKSYYSEMFEEKEKLKEIFKNGNSDAVIYMTVKEDEVSTMTISAFETFGNKKTPIDADTKDTPETDSNRDYKNAENFIINGKKIDKEELVEKYIPVEDYHYNNKTKTLSVSSSSEFSERYYSHILDLMKDMKGKDNSSLEGLTYFKLTSDYKVVTMKISDMKTSKISNTDDKLGKVSFSESSKKSDKSFLKLDSEYDDMRTVFIVDGKKAKKGKVVTINLAEVESVNVIKSPEELKAEGYNSNFVDEIIKITTKKQASINASQHQNSNKRYKSTLSQNDQNVIYLVDGEEVEQNNINEISPNQIESIEVIKTVSEIKAKGYNPEEVKGLIKITTKKSSSASKSQKKGSQPSFKAKDGQTLIYLVDGKEVESEDFYNLDPEKIKSFDVIKSSYDIKAEGYKPKEVDGLLKVTTKKSDSEDTDKIKNRK